MPSRKRRVGIECGKCAGRGFVFDHYPPIHNTKKEEGLGTAKGRYSSMVVFVLFIFILLVEFLFIL